MRASCPPQMYLTKGKKRPEGRKFFITDYPDMILDTNDGSCFDILPGC
ncbi:MAG: hypothetical protein F6K39_11345 [Okeania sp. SIO3B3]|nr:hypothetical protein [Okeania sp. SIO3B3]